MKHAPPLTAAIATILLFAATGHARQLPNDAEVKQQIIQESIADYKATGHPCACPYDTARNGSSCGRRSAYSRPGGAEPLCYPSDVTEQMMLDWKRQHRD